jgi:glycosyltransferase involved in cell wall biosynthesis
MNEMLVSHHPSPIRIGMIFNHGTIIGGGEISFLDLILGLDRRKWVPIVWLPEDGSINNCLKENKIETRVVSLPPLRGRSLFIGFIKTILQLKRQFIQEKISLTHINGARAMLYAGLAAKLAKIPAVWHVRVLERDGWLDKIRGLLASIIIANSKAVAQSIKPYQGKKECYVVYNGLTLEKWGNAARADLHQRFNIRGGIPVILYTGRLSKWKGIDTLIKACAELKKQGILFYLLIVGQPDKYEPEHERFLKKLAEKENIAEEAIFAGWQDDVPALMKAASVLVLPSHNEPFGRVIIEAWASGLPVIATKAGGAAELISENQDGLFFEIDDTMGLTEKLKLILTDKLLAKMLQENGIKKVAQFSLNKHIENICNIYQGLVKRDV